MDYNEYKERVRSATDIADVIGRYVDLKRAGTSSCPVRCFVVNIITGKIAEDNYFGCQSFDFGISFRSGTQFSSVIFSFPAGTHSFRAEFSARAMSII